MGKMKANRKFIDADERAVSAVIGVILMVAITVAIAATVYVYVSGMIGSGPSATATVSMVQSGSFVTITGVEKGPITNTSASAIFVNQTTGVSISAVILAANGVAANVDGGDTIRTPTSVSSQGAGWKFTVQILYAGNAIGTCVYTR